MKKRRIKVRKHRRRLRAGGNTIVTRHFRKLNSSSTRWKQDKKPLRIERLIPGTSKALAKIDKLPVDLIKGREQHFQIISPDNKTVTYQNQEIISIPLEHKKLLDLKLRLWSDLNSDFPMILQFNPEAYFFDVLELSDKQYFDSLVEIIKLDDRLPILNEVNYVLSDLIKNRRLYREDAERLQLINNQKINAIREADLRRYAEKWQKWKDYPGYLESL